MQTAKLLLAASMITLAAPAAKANDGLDMIFQGISRLVDHHHDYRYYAPPPDVEQGPPPEQQDEQGPPQEPAPGAPGPAQSDPSIPHRLIGWLEKHGETIPLIVGRRDLDCHNAHDPNFIGGWGVLLKRENASKATIAVSGVVCVAKETGPMLYLDK